MWYVDFKDKSGRCQTLGCGKPVHRRTKCISNVSNHFCKACADRRFRQFREMTVAKEEQRKKRSEAWMEKTTPNSIQNDIDVPYKQLRFQKMSEAQRDAAFSKRNGA